MHPRSLGLRKRHNHHRIAEGNDEHDSGRTSRCPARRVGRSRGQRGSGRSQGRLRPQHRHDQRVRQELRRVGGQHQWRPEHRRLADAGQGSSQYERGILLSSDQSSFYGLDAGILAKAGSITMNGGSTATTGDGANGVFAYGSGTTVTLNGTRISATGKYAHGIMASGGGTIKATNVTASTNGSNGAVIATDRGGGTITVSGGSYSASGVDSPGIYSTGSIKVTGAAVKATGAEAAVIEGSNSVSLTRTALSGAKKWGVMIYQSFSGDAQGSTGTWTQKGGSLSAAEGPLFHVTNATAVVTLHGVNTSATSGVLLKAASNKWGTSGANGGKATLVAIAQKLSGSVIVDKISTATLKLTNGSAWTGAIDTSHTAKSATVSLDSTSTWTVTATSYLTSLTGLTVSGSRVRNIVGNGHTIYYDRGANSNLAGKTYTLTGGGTLQPA
jgi:hypothetical protein